MGFTCHISYRWYSLPELLEEEPPINSKEYADAFVIPRARDWDGDEAYESNQKSAKQPSFFYTYVAPSLWPELLCSNESDECIAEKERQIREEFIPIVEPLPEEVVSLIISKSMPEQPNVDDDFEFELSDVFEIGF